MKTEIVCGLRKIKSIGVERDSTGRVVNIYADLAETNGGTIRLILWEGLEVNFEQTPEMSILKW